MDFLQNLCGLAEVLQRVELRLLCLEHGFRRGDGKIETVHDTLVEKVCIYES